MEIRGKSPRSLEEICTRLRDPKVPFAIQEMLLKEVDSYTQSESEETKNKAVSFLIECLNESADVSLRWRIGNLICSLQSKKQLNDLQELAYYRYRTSKRYVA